MIANAAAVAASQVVGRDALGRLLEVAPIITAITN